MRVKKLVVACVLALAAGLTPAIAASAQQECDVDALDYAQNPVLTISPSTVSPGDTVTIEGRGFPPNVLVPVRMNAEVIGRFSTDGAGAFTTEFVIPLDTPLGPVTFSADCGGEILASTSIRVAESAPVSQPPPPPGPLPTTGSNATGTLLRLGIALVAAGALAVAVSRNRRAVASDPSR